MAQTDLQTSVSRTSLWIGRIVSGLPALFLLVDGAMKLAKPAVVVEATTQTRIPGKYDRPDWDRLDCLHDSLSDSARRRCLVRFC